MSSRDGELGAGRWSALRAGLAAWAPVGQSSKLSLAARRDLAAAAAARATGAAVYPATLASSTAAGRHSGAATEVRSEQPARRGERPMQALILDGADRGPGVQTLDEADLALVHVADAGHGPLIQHRQRTPDPELTSDEGRKPHTNIHGTKQRLHIHEIGLDLGNQHQAVHGMPGDEVNAPTLAAPAGAHLDPHPPTPALESRLPRRDQGGVISVEQPAQLRSVPVEPDVHPRVERIENSAYGFERQSGQFAELDT